MKLENNLWFYYKAQTSDGAISSACSTDALIFDFEFDYVIVVEIKNTWTPLAMEKLVELYCPVILRVFGKPVKPLVLVRNLIPGAPLPKLSLSAALISAVPLLQWSGTGNIRI